jgi:RNA polymerase sigma-70 factor, ECF subfamily
MFNFISKLKRGNNEAFLKQLEGRLNVLYRIAYSYFKDSDKASDAVQDVILIAYKKFDNLREKEKFNSWITTILVNRCRDILRREKRIEYEELQDEVIDISKYQFIQGRGKDEYSRVEEKLDMINLLQKLDYKYSEVIRLKYLGDYTIEEISKILDIPQGTVKSRLNFGIKKLKVLMEVKDNVM